MPDILFKTLLPNGRGLIFKDVEIKNPSVLLNTHVKLMLDKKVPLNIISKLLGFQNLNEFDAVFGFLLPKDLEDGFEISGLTDPVFFAFSSCRVLLTVR